MDERSKGASDSGRQPFASCARTSGAQLATTTRHESRRAAGRHMDRGNCQARRGIVWRMRSRRRVKGGRHEEGRRGGNRVSRGVGVKLRALVVCVWKASVRGMIVKRAGVRLCPEGGKGAGKTVRGSGKAAKRAVRAARARVGLRRRQESRDQRACLYSMKRGRTHTLAGRRAQLLGHLLNIGPVITALERLLDLGHRHVERAAAGRRRGGRRSERRAAAVASYRSGQGPGQ